MNTITDYMLTNGIGKDLGEAQEELNKAVSRLMTIGWQPFGGVINCGYFFADKVHIFSQAMVKYSAEKIVPSS